MQVVVVSLIVLIILPVCTSFITSGINEALGGQNGPYTKTMSLCYIGVALAGLLLMPFLANFSMFNLTLSIVVISAQAGVIPIQGLMINVLPMDVKYFGNLFANFIFGCVGYLPSPFLWGIVLD